MKTIFQFADLSLVTPAVVPARPGGEVRLSGGAGSEAGPPPQTGQGEGTASLHFLLLSQEGGGGGRAGGGDLLLLLLLLLLLPGLLLVVLLPPPPPGLLIQLLVGALLLPHIWL